ncbi:MAG TPA: hypothetical protein VKS60_14475 [Stellaceae bacterium]|nr:hypothetical protein [Stellaceae bacterium]
MSATTSENADIDLSPRDGLSDVWVEFDGLDRHVEGADADVRFRFIHREDGINHLLSTIAFPIEAQADGIEGQIVRGYDKLIAMLRQALWSASIEQTGYTRTPTA